MVQVATCLPSTCCNTDFAVYLADASVLTAISVPSAGDLVLYSTETTGCFTHTGVVRSESILSKWGVGHLWLHDLWEVPASYGDAKAFYRLRAPSDVSKRFVDFARQREGTIVDEVLHTASS